MSGHCLTWIVQNSNPTSQFLCAALLFCGSLMDIPPQSTHPCRQTRIRLNWAGRLACHRLSQCSASPSGHPKPWHDSRPFLSLYCLSRLSISVNYSTSDLSSRVELSRLRIGDLDRERERGTDHPEMYRKSVQRYTQAGKRLQQNLSLDGNCLSSWSLSKQFIKKFIKLFQALAGQPRPSASSRGSLSLSIFDLWNLGRSKSKESKVRSSVPHRMPFRPKNATSSHVVGILAKQAQKLKF